MAKRYYIIPMAYPATDIERHLPIFTQYGLGVLDIFASVFRSLLEDDSRYHIDIVNTINRTVRQQWYEIQLSSSGSYEAIHNEIDDMSMLCIDICNDLHEHILRYMDIIQAEEKKASGEDCSLWGIHGTDGNDIILICEDPIEEIKSQYSGDHDDTILVQVR